MSKFWRIAFAWLLALALPIQGVAAQTMLLCGPAHHQTVAADASGAREHASFDHHNDINDLAAHDQATDAGAAVASTDEAKPSKAAHAGKCSVCSSCCNAATMTSAVVTIDVIPQSMPAFATIPAANDRVLIGGLDRPPRPALV